MVEGAVFAQKNGSPPHSTLSRLVIPPAPLVAMTEKLPPHLIRLFVPRPQPKYTAPLDRDLGRRRGPTVEGIGAYFSLLKDHDPDYVSQETPEQRRLRVVGSSVGRHVRIIRAMADDDLW